MRCTNPRKVRTCQRCAKVIAEPPARDHGLEQTALADASEMALRVNGEHSGPFARLVTERLELGAETYGDLAFHDRDNLLEAFPEAADSAAYILLDLQRLRPSMDDEQFVELRHAAVTAISAAIHLDVAVRRLVATRADLSPTAA